MTTRRELIQAGITAAAAAVLGASVLARAAAWPADAKLPLYKVVVEQRDAAARAFGAVAASKGERVHAIEGSVQSLWYHDLHRQWRQSPAAIAGMTRYDAFFLLELMARDADLRTIYRGHHGDPSDPGRAHEYFGPGSVLGGRKRSLHGTASWPKAVAGLVTSWPVQAIDCRAESSSISAARQRDLSHDALVSWVIAPRIAAQRI
jgi:hypothetical protein